MTQPPPRATPRLPTAKRRELSAARRLEWLTLVLRVTVVAALYATLGGSTALTAIWLKSLWALLPPVAFLAASHIETRGPTTRFPHGFSRATSIAFLTSALTLTTMGLFLLYSAARAFVAARHPVLAPIGANGPAWHWSGWPILAALFYSVLVPVIAGPARRRLALALHDKGLYADATMGRVSWRAGGAAALGVLGIGLGLWWADFAATLIIALDIVWLGARHLNTAVCDLIDEVPRRIGSHELDPLAADIRQRLEALDWVADCRVRLREEGRLFTGVALVRPHARACSGEQLTARLDRARERITESDWRLLYFEIVPVGERRWREAFERR